MPSTLIINDHYFLEEVSLLHLTDITYHLNNLSIEKYMLRLPSPYSITDANAFYLICETLKKEHGKIMHYHILNSNREAIGGIGLRGKYGINSNADEIGYWIAESHWNRGIMSRVLHVFTSFLNTKHYLNRIEAVVFKGNEASAKILIKNGFTNEGLIEGGLLKKDKKIEAYLFSKLYI
jgi:RimJ/RimL family protein N-acetyltransferase